MKRISKTELNARQKDGAKVSHIGNKADNDPAIKITKSTNKLIGAMTEEMSKSSDVSNKLIKELQNDRGSHKEVIKGFDAVIEKIASNGEGFSSLVEAVNELANVVAKKEVETGSSPIDITPLVEAIQSRTYPAYGLTIQRNRQGQMKYIKMEPIGE